MFLCFLTFSIVFPKTALFINLKKSFSKPLFAFYLSLVLISINSFSQPFWLNLINLWTFFKNNPWFNGYCKFLRWIAYIDFLYKVVTSFSIFSSFPLSGKNGKSLWISCNFSEYWPSISRKYPSLLSLL